MSFVWGRRLAVLVLLVLASSTLTMAPASAATSAIDSRYQSDTAVAKLLGAPTGPEFSVAGGRQRNYQWGSLYWSSTTGVHELHGALWWNYKARGGPAKLGFPTSDEILQYWRFDTITMAYNTFPTGALMWSRYMGTTYWMPKAFLDKWEGWYQNGAPMSPDTNIGTDRWMQKAENGNFYRSPTTGAHFVGDGMHDPFRGIFERYTALGGHTSFLGLPTSDMVVVDTPTYDYGAYQDFRWGSLYQSNTGTFEVHGAILHRYKSIGIAKLGFPTSDELAAPGGRVSKFEKGEIFWNASTGVVTVTYY